MGALAWEILLAMIQLALKIAIVEARTTQRVVAREAGMPESRLSDLIHGWRVPREDEKAALARVLGRPVTALFEDDKPHVAA